MDADNTSDDDDAITVEEPLNTQRRNDSRRSGQQKRKEIGSFSFLVLTCNTFATQMFLSKSEKVYFFLIR